MTAVASVVCIVLNFNGAPDTIACVQSLLAQDYPSLQILIVDNASTDDSLTRIRSSLPSVELLQADSNRGFAAGNNLGIRLALERNANFIWLLNNDTFSPADTLSQLIATAQSSGAGITGTVLRYFHNHSEIQAWGGGSLSRWSGFSRHFKSLTPLGPESFLTFASVLVRQDVFRQVGLLDENYFMYFEDADFCFRARSVGYSFAVASGTAVLHKEGGSTPGLGSPAKVRIFTASGLRFLSCYGRPRFLAPIVFLLSRLLKRLVRADFSSLRAVLQGSSDWRHNRATPWSPTESSPPCD